MCVPRCTCVYMCMCVGVHVCIRKMADTRLTIECKRKRQQYIHSREGASNN